MTCLKSGELLTEKGGMLTPLNKANDRSALIRRNGVHLSKIKVTDGLSRRNGKSIAKPNR
jgi:hypothetical protein